MNEVVQHAAPVVIESETQALISAIERAASNPKINVDKMRQLLDMQKDIMAQRKEDLREHKAELFNSAMSDCQSEMRPIAVNAENPQTRSQYANYAQLDHHLRPIYTKHGFSLSFDEADSPKPGHVRVVCYVAHRDGHCRPYRRDMPADGKGAKGGDVMTLTHAIGSAFTYAQRYLLKGIFNVATGEYDDDGNGAGGGDETGYITEDQAAELHKRLKAIHADTPKSLANFLAWIKAGSVERIAAKNYKVALDRIDQKGKELAAGGAK